MNNKIKLGLCFIAALAFIGCIFGTVSYCKQYNLNDGFLLFICCTAVILFFAALWLISEDSK